MSRAVHTTEYAHRWLPPALVLLAAVVVAMCVLLAAPRTGNAQEEAASVRYAAGWNLVAAPTGTELTGTAGAQYSFDAASKGYVPVQPGELIAGRAAWAYFGEATALPLGRTASDYSRVHVAANGWVLVGDPSSTLTLPISGADDAESYDATRQAYVAVTTLSPGQGAWVMRYTDGYVLIGTPGSDAISRQAARVQTELTANPTDRGTLDQAAAVGAELLAQRSYAGVQAELDDFRAAEEEGIRALGGSALGAMTPREAQATRAVRYDLAQAQEAVQAGSSAGADQAVSQALLEAAASEADGLAVAGGAATASPAPATRSLRYDLAPGPSQLAAFGTLVRAGFLSIGLGQRLPDSFWSVATALLNGTPPHAAVPASQPSATATPTTTPTPARPAPVVSIAIVPAALPAANPPAASPPPPSCGTGSAGIVALVITICSP